MQISLNPEIIAAVLAVIYVVAIASALEAILRARTAQGAIAWVVSLLTLPYVTVPLYLVLGRNRFEGYIREREQIEAQAQARLRDARSELFDFKSRDADAAFYRGLQRLARLPMVRGNRVELLIDGYATFDSIEAGLRRPSTTSCFSSIFCATTPWAGVSAPSWRKKPAPVCACMCSTTR
jgi:cardiolipin synthase